MRFTDPNTGKEVKGRVSDSIERVRIMAEHLTGEAYLGRGYLPGRAKAPTLQEGILEAARLSRASIRTKSDLLRRTKPFLIFIFYSAVKTWDSIHPGMIESYGRFCEEKNRAPDTVRMRMALVNSAWRRMHADYPERVRPPVAIRIPPIIRDEIICLDADEVEPLLDWLKAYNPSLWAMACLQALCGLRMLEAAMLRSQDVDLWPRAPSPSATRACTSPRTGRPAGRSRFVRTPLKF